MATSGRLGANDPVRQGPSGHWVPAQLVRGLFPAESGHPPPATASPPEPTPVSDARAEQEGRRRRLRAEPLSAGDVGLGGSGLGSAMPPPLPRGPSPPAMPSPPVSDAAAPNRAAAPADDAFAFLEEVYSAPPTSTVTGMKPVGTSKARQQQKIFLAVILGLLGVLTVLLIVLAVVSTLRDPSRPANLAEAAREAGAKAENPWDQKEPAKGTISDKAVAALEKARAIPWLDATKAEWKVGDLSVRVAGAEITRPRLFNLYKPAGLAPEDFLVIKLELKLANSSPTRRLDYLRWDGPTERPKLTDNYESDYALQSLSTGSFAEGQAKVRSVIPERTTEDALLFQIDRKKLRQPIEKVKFLRLELPGAVLRGSGTGYFEIPISMLVKVAPDEKSPPAEKPPTAGPLASQKASADGGIPDLNLRRQEDKPGKPSAAPPPAEEGAFDRLPSPDPPAPPDRKP